MSHTVRFANFSIPMEELVATKFIRDPKLPNIIAYCLEMCISLIGNASCLLFLATLRRTKCFHPNLNLLLCNFIITMILLSISRYIIVMPMIVSFLVGERVDTIGWCRFGKTLHDGCIYFAAMDMCILVVERTVATVFVRSYEKNNRIGLGLVLLVFQYSFGIILLVANQISSSSIQVMSKSTPCLREYLNHDILKFIIIFVTSSDLISIAVFLYLLHVNKRRYSEKDIQTKDYLLGERYQIVENVRSTRLLYPLMVVFLLISVLAIFLLVIMFRVVALFMYSTDNFGVVFSLGGQSFDILLATYTIIFPWMALNSHKKLMKSSKLIMQSVNTRLRPKSSQIAPETSRPQIHDLNGRSLLPPNITDETNIYFKNLQDAWNK